MQSIVPGCWSGTCTASAPGPAGPGASAVWLQPLMSSKGNALPVLGTAEFNLDLLCHFYSFSD